MGVIKWMYDLLPLLRKLACRVISSEVIIFFLVINESAEIWTDFFGGLHLDSLCLFSPHLPLPFYKEKWPVYLTAPIPTPTPGAKCWPALSWYVISGRCHWLAFSYPLNCPFSSGLFFPSPAIITIWWTVTGSCCPWASAALGNCIILPAPARFSPV